MFAYPARLIAKLTISKFDATITTIISALELMYHQYEIKLTVYTREYSTYFGENWRNLSGAKWTLLTLGN